MVLIPVGGWKFFSEKILTFIYWFIIFEINQRNTILKNLVRGGEGVTTPSTPPLEMLDLLVSLELLNLLAKLRSLSLFNFTFLVKGKICISPDVQLAYKMLLVICILKVFYGWICLAFFDIINENVSSYPQGGTHLNPILGKKDEHSQFSFSFLG